MSIFQTLVSNKKCYCKNNPRMVVVGRKCTLTKEEIAHLWVRDRAYRMKQPTLDRIDTHGDYTYENCRFLERSDNLRRPRCRKSPSVHRPKNRCKLLRETKTSK